jgi:hypothetical protein
MDFMTGSCWWHGGNVRHITKDAPAATTVAVREVGVTTGIPTFGRGASAAGNRFVRVNIEDAARGLSAGTGYGNNTGLIAGPFRPRGTAWLS